MKINWDAVVRSVLEEARKSAGGGAALAEALRQNGVGPETGAYSESAVSNWIKGRTRPPADVVLAAAAFADISLDERLHIPPSPRIAAEPTPSSDLPSDELVELREKFGKLEAMVHELYGRMGYPMPGGSGR